MDEGVAVYLANRVGQLELDKGQLMADLNNERKLRGELESRLRKLEEENNARNMPTGEVAPTEQHPVGA